MCGFYSSVTKVKLLLIIIFIIIIINNNDNDNNNTVGTVVHSVLITKVYCVSLKSNKDSLPHKTFPMCVLIYALGCVCEFANL